MRAFEERFWDYRRRNLGLMGKFIYQDTPEVLDLFPESDAAVQIIKDLETLAKISGLQNSLADLICRYFESSAIKQPAIIEVCGGSCWLLRSVMRKAAANGLTVQAIGSDLSSRHVESNLERFPNDGIEWVKADAADLIYPGGKFDVAISCQALHHFQPGLVVRLLSELNRVARKVVIFDLRRTLYGATFVRLLSPFFSEDFIRDGVSSHRRAYSIGEMEYLIKSAGLPYRVKPFTPVGMVVESV